MVMSNDRGRGASGPKIMNKVVERYGISPQLAPPRLTPDDKACLNSDIVATPQIPRLATGQWMKARS